MVIGLQVILEWMQLSAMQTWANKADAFVCKAELMAVTQCWAGWAIATVGKTGL